MDGANRPKPAPPLQVKSVETGEGPVSFISVLRLVVHMGSEGALNDVFSVLQESSRAKTLVSSRRALRRDEHQRTKGGSSDFPESTLARRAQRSNGQPIRDVRHLAV